MEKQYYTPPELAAHLEVPLSTIRFWLRKAELPFYKFGRHIRFNIAKIQKWEKSKEIPAFRKVFN